MIASIEKGIPAPAHVIGRRPCVQPCLEFQTMKLMEVGDSFLVENGDTVKRKNKNWKPFAYITKWGQRGGRNYRYRSQKDQDGNQRIWRVR